MNIQTPNLNRIARACAIVEWPKLRIEVVLKDYCFRATLFYGVQPVVHGKGSTAAMALADLDFICQIYE